MEDNGAGLKDASTLLNVPFEIDLEKYELKESFNDALKRLNEFIKANFKPEEIYAVDQSHWR